jgi:hypothetical protein
MTRERHTPGPWETQAIDEDGEMRGCVTVIGSNLGGLVGAAMPWPTELDSGDFSRVEANAALIAAAPDLYEALKAYEAATVYLESYEPDMNPDRFKEVADALFAEAERLSALAISRAESTALSGQT